MDKAPDTTALDGHFAFGRNWERYARLIDPARIANAETSLLEFVPAEDIEAARFLDIGCGSGLFSLAALGLGAGEVTAIDIDPVALSTTEKLLQVAGFDGRWSVRNLSIFELGEAGLGRFDIVYSWGVLHHTGDMWRAIECATRFVRPGGLLFLALYRKTALCGLWRIEKRWFAHGPEWYRTLARRAYRAAFVTGLLATGRRPAKFFADYRHKRGMDWSHDMEDWLGGYPYDSVRPVALRDFLAKDGFALVSSKVRRGGGGSACSARAATSFCSAGAISLARRSADSQALSISTPARAPASSVCGSA